MTTKNRKLVFKDYLPKELKVSSNEIYKGIHYSKRKKIKDSYYDYYSFLIRRKIKKVTKYPIDISILFTFTKNPLDSSNCSYMLKMIEDILVSEGIIKDDSSKYVEWVSSKSIKGMDDTIEIYFSS
jgi:hypothetical protein